MSRKQYERKPAVSLHSLIINLHSNTFYNAVFDCINRYDLAQKQALWMPDFTRPSVYAVGSRCASPVETMNMKSCIIGLQVDLFILL